MNRAAAVTLLRASRDWRPYGVAVAVASLAAVLLGRNNIGFSSFVGYYGPLALAIAVIGGLFEYSQRASVWLLVAQRRGAETTRLWSILAFAAALYLAATSLLLTGVLAGIALNADAPAPTLRATIVVLPLWTVMIGFAVAVTSTMVRTRSGALALCWIVSPLLLEMAQTSLGFSATFRHAIEFLLPPFDAVFQFGAVLRGDRPEQALRFTAQLVFFPVMCLLLLRWRIAILATPDRVRIE